MGAIVIIAFVLAIGVVAAVWLTILEKKAEKRR